MSLLETDLSRCSAQESSVCKHSWLTQTTLSDALELAIEREILAAEMDADEVTPIVRAAEMTEL